MTTMFNRPRRLRYVKHGPFGETLRSTGLHASKCNWKFSTKYADQESGWVYYSRRYYTPSKGTWASRDLLEERGGLGLYVMNENHPVDSVDPDGLLPTTIGPIATDLAELFQRPAVQSRLNSLSCLMRELDKFVPSVVAGHNEWLPRETSDLTTPAQADDLRRRDAHESSEALGPWGEVARPQIQYFLRNYSSSSSWWVRPIWPKGDTYGYNPLWGIAPAWIDTEHFFTHDPLKVIGTLLHEPQHDWSRYGWKYDGTGLADVVTRLLWDARYAAGHTFVEPYCCGKKEVANRWDDILCICELL